MELQEEPAAEASRQPAELRPQRRRSCAPPAARGRRARRRRGGGGEIAAGRFLRAPGRSSVGGYSLARRASLDGESGRRTSAGRRWAPQPWCTPRSRTTEDPGETEFADSLAGWQSNPVAAASGEAESAQLRGESYTRFAWKDSAPSAQTTAEEIAPLCIGVQRCFKKVPAGANSGNQSPQQTERSLSAEPEALICNLDLQRISGVHTTRSPSTGAQLTGMPYDTRASLS